MMINTLHFLTPSLHANTLLDIAYPEPGPSNPDTMIRNLAINYGDHQPLGHIKRLVPVDENKVRLTLSIDELYSSVIDDIPKARGCGWYISHFDTLLRRHINPFYSKSLSPHRHLPTISPPSSRRYMGWSYSRQQVSLSFTSLYT